MAIGPEGGGGLHIMRSAVPLRAELGWPGVHRKLRWWAGEYSVQRRRGHGMAEGGGGLGARRKAGA